MPNAQNSISKYDRNFSCCIIKEAFSDLDVFYFIFLPNGPGQDLQYLLNESDKSGYSGLVVILEKNFQLFTIKYDVICGLVIAGFYYIEICYLYT